MKRSFTNIIAVALLATLAMACGNSQKEQAGKLGEKKAELAKLQAESATLLEKITLLESEIAKLDTAAAKVETGKLISVLAVAPQDFNHYIELQGRVDADDISYVTPRGMGGQVKALYVKQGDVVSKGQLLLKLDDRIANQQLEQLKTQLNFAEDIYKRRQNLWKQGIGSEVELLSAKNNVDNLNKQIDLVKEQISMTNVYAEVSGFVNTMNARVGQVFQGVSGVTPDITIINTSRLKVITDVPENYLSKVNKGSRVEISIPDIGKNFNSNISFISASINPASRGFATEARLPADASLKPNQLALVRILDYAAPSAMVVPVNLVQSDEKGKYVFVAVTEKNGMVARKKPVIVGQVQGEQVEIKMGLSAGDQLVAQGYQGLYDGQKVALN
ncbi:MAG: efflux RND transporter periplasmic adaptor subunit [Bacteroidetes bacterium]|uniref:efflux RND transporter periplasmic adaptor subunit n=1 Tax=Phnomibacter sp. TaxID=2836217 RepID=UPI002FDC9CD4|nr:efflux RND transporter periplasmic adaptor subunit [Bacteroidota bacterium]